MMTQLILRKKKRPRLSKRPESGDIGYSDFSESYRNDNEKQLTQQKKIVTIDSEGKLREILPQQLKKRKATKSRLNYLDLNVGFYVLTPILLGVLIGLAMDNWLGKKPFFVSTGIVVGTIASFYNLFTFLKDEQRSAH